VLFSVNASAVFRMRQSVRLKYDRSVRKEVKICETVQEWDYLSFPDADYQRSDGMEGKRLEGQM
jgi:hypothetical protein